MWIERERVRLVTMIKYLGRMVEKEGDVLEIIDVEHDIVEDSLDRFPRHPSHSPKPESHQNPTQKEGCGGIIGLLLGCMELCWNHFFSGMTRGTQ
jgi:hypothetical protein